MLQYGHAGATARIQPWKHFSPLLGSRDLTRGLCGKGVPAELSWQSRLAGILIDSWGRKDERKLFPYQKKTTKMKTSELVRDAVFPLTFWDFRMLF